MAFSWRIATTSSPTMESGADAATLLAAVDDEYSPHQESVAAVQGSRRRQQVRFKGVVLQPNGRWGAQIYEGQERVWLGSFPDQETAARAYDVASLRYRGWGAATNFPADKGRHLAFLAAHPRSEVVDMLRNQTYADELRRRGVPAPPAWARVPLFEKAVTASDVGKLNRLVVPKRHAERHLPAVRAAAGEEEQAAGSSRVVLAVEDREGKVWRFRYSYWESSQSYVLTKGWIRFVREKGLRAGDTVAFSKWTFGPDEQLLIDCRKKPRKQKKNNKDAGTGGAHHVVQGGAPVVKLFGVDIAVVGGREDVEGPMASSFVLDEEERYERASACCFLMVCPKP